MASEHSKLQKTLKNMAVIDFILCLVLFIISVIGIGVNFESLSTETKVFTIVAPMVAQVQLISDCLLCGEILYNRKLCKIWILTTSILTIFHILILSTGASTSITFFIFVRVIRILFTICEIVVVALIMKELENLSKFPGQGVIVAAPIFPNVIQELTAHPEVAVSGWDHPPPYESVYPNHATK